MWISGQQVLKCSEHVGAHIKTRPESTVYQLSDGNIRIIEPMCDGHHSHANKPDVLWFVCQAGPRVAPNVNPGVDSPYSAVDYPPNPNNAAQPGTPETHELITRHWKYPRTITYTVHKPFPITPAPTSCAFPNVILCNMNAFAYSTPGYYTYVDFETDINSIFSAIQQNSFLDLQFTASGTTDWEAGLPATPALVSTDSFEWRVGGTPAGPTGNGVNDIIFLKNHYFVASGGGVSMDVDPDNGAINECDIMFSALVPPGAPPAWPVGGYGPRFTTGLIHEIGHFLGLDHTNLAPGCGSNNIPNGGSPTSYAINFASTSQFPAMVGAFTWAFTATGVPANYVAQFVTQFPALGTTLPTGANSDDLAGLARLYPIAMCDSPTLGKLPWINRFGTIRGKAIYAGVPQFGANVLLSSHVVSGTPVTVPGVPVVGTVSGTARLAPTSIVGALDLGTSAATTGDYRLILVPTGSWDIVGEPLTSAGIYLAPNALPNGGTGLFPVTFGEWWYHTATAPNASINPGYNPLWNTTTSPGQTAIISSAGSGSTLDSLQVVPGSVIDVQTPLELAGSPAFENVSRPLVEILQRGLVGGLIPTSITIRVTTATVRPPPLVVTANGALVSPTYVSGPVGGGPFQWTFNLPSAAIPSGSVRPLNVTATAKEGTTPPYGTSVYGINTVIY